MYRSVGKEGDGLEELMGKRLHLQRSAEENDFLVLDQNNLLVRAANRYVLCSAPGRWWQREAFLAQVFLGVGGRKRRQARGR